MKLKILLFALLLLPLRLMAQVVTGKVIDDEDKPLPSVIIKRYAAGHKMRGYASSGSNGAFSIKAEAGDSLEFSCSALLPSASP